jgi:hypothetical protein
VSTRKFNVGQPVYLRPSASMRDAAFGTYEIRALLPEEDGQFRYRIKSPVELHERVVRENELTGCRRRRAGRTFRSTPADRRGDPRDRGGESRPERRPAQGL